MYNCLSEHPPKTKSAPLPYQASWARQMGQCNVKVCNSQNRRASPGQFSIGFTSAAGRRRRVVKARPTKKSSSVTGNCTHSTSPLAPCNLVLGGKPLGLKRGGWFLFRWQTIGEGPADKLTQYIALLSMWLRPTAVPPISTDRGFSTKDQGGLPLSFSSYRGRCRWVAVRCLCDEPALNPPACCTGSRGGRVLYRHHHTVRYGIILAQISNNDAF